MNYKTGDKVRFLNEVGEGIIKSFQNNNIANVEMEDGFEIPMRINEIIKIEDGTNHKVSDDGMKETIAFNEKEYHNTPDQININDNDGLFIAIVKKGIDSYNLYMVNDTDFHIQYLMCKNDKETVSYISSGILEDNTKIIIDTLTLDRISGLGSVTFQVIYYGKKSFSLQDPLNKTIDLGKLSIQNNLYIKNDFFEDRAVLIKLENDDLSKEIKKLSKADINAVISIKEEKPKKVGDFLKKEKKIKNQTEEVDLHIESIVDDHSDMTNGEIINTQLSRFEIALNGAIKNNQRRIIFIHGVGNGKLKYEMGKIMDRKYPDLKYQDASFKEYGYGAMLVIIK